MTGFTKALDVLAGRRRRTLKLDLEPGAPTVTTIDGPVLLRSIVVHTVMSAHAVSFADDTAELFSAPASSSAGANLLEGIEGGIRFATSLVITPNASSTGVLVITYDELN